MHFKYRKLEVLDGEMRDRDREREGERERGGADIKADVLTNRPKLIDR